MGLLRSDGSADKGSRGEPADQAGSCCTTAAPAVEAARIGATVVARPIAVTRPKAAILAVAGRDLAALNRFSNPAEALACIGYCGTDVGRRESKAEGCRRQKGASS